MTEFDLHAFRSIMEDLMIAFEQKFDRKLEKQTKELKSYTDRQTRQLKEYVDLQTEDLATIISASNTITDHNYVRKEEFEKHLLDSHAT